MPKLTGKDFFRQVVNFIYGEHLLGWRFNISITVVTTYMHFIGSPDVGTNDFGLRVISVLASQAVLLLGINLSYRTCKFLFNKSNAPIAFIATLPIIGAARGFTIQYALFEFEIMNHEDFTYRMIGSAVILPIAVAFLGYLIGITTEWKRKSMELRESHRALSSLLSDAELKSETELSADLDFIKTELLRGLQSTSVKKNEELVATLANLVSDVLKPMSAQLISASPLPPLKTREIQEAKFRASSLIEFLTLKNTSNPWAITLFLVVTYLPVMVRFEGVIVTAQAVAITLALVTPVIYFLRNFASKFVDPLHYYIRVPLIVVCLGLAHLPLGLLLPMMVQPGPVIEVLPLQALVAIEIVGLSLGMGGAVEEEVRRVMRDLSETAKKIQWRTAHLYSTHWFNKRQFARKLHGPVQAEILANIVRLERESETARAGSFAKDTIAAKLLKILSAPRTQVNPTLVLNEIAETWDGICEINLNIRTPAEEAFQRDQVAAETALEIIREACSNAIHHGKATRIDICVEPVDSDCISLSVKDNGSGADPMAGEGMGSRHLIECSVNHSLTSSPAGTSLLAVIPVVAS
jgi:signal transduction histidine kinase